MSITKEMNLPGIINMGVFDAELIFNDMKVTPPRKVTAFEIEIPVQDGGLSYINHKTYPIRKDCIICTKPGQIRHTVLPNNYCCKNTLEDVAKSVNLSPIYFHKLFSQTTGQTPYEYLLENHLHIAKDLLLCSNKSFTEIAFECGFTSQSYFNYVFKKQVGVTPKQYKKNVYDKYPIT